MIDQLPGIILAAPVLVFGEYRHESLRKRALGKQPPQQIRDSEGDEESVSCDAGAERARNHRVAHESQDARHQGHAADGRERPQQAHAAAPGSGEQGAARAAAARRPAAADPWSVQRWRLISGPTGDDLAKNTEGPYDNALFHVSSGDSIWPI